ncbi:MAG: TIR domain-containing protein [Polyangiaceae bacterium]|nr:TIR domain-containing protein [Polyangiaceae bacterium]
MSPVAPQPLRLFISYSHKDAKLKDELLEHLEVVRRFEGVDVWTDDRIEPGADWREEIEKGLQQADVALLLVSPSFLASKFIQDGEVPDVLARQAAQGLLVIPVIIRDCAWQEHPVIQRFHPLPRDGEPITRHKGNRRDRAFTEVSKEVAKLARKRSGRAVVPPPSPSQTGRGSYERVTPIPGPVGRASYERVPPPPPSPSQSGMLDRDGPPSGRMDWTGQINVWEMLGVITNMAVDRREDDLVGRAPLLEEVREALHAKGGRGVVLFGMTGIGKTWIAQAVASSARREQAFPGGVFWVPGSTHEEFLTGLASIGVALGKNEEAPEEVKIETARRALRDPKEPALLVVDHIDAPAPWVQQELEAVARGTRVLATTTHAPTGFLHGPGRAHWVRVDALERDDAYAWVQSLAPRLRPSEVDMLLSFFERHTLALDVAARTLHDDPMLPVSRYLDSLRQGRDYTDEPEVTGAGLTALQALRFLSEHTTPAARKAWSVAGCFASAPIPVGWLRAALAVLGMSDGEARAGVKELVRRHLGVRVGEGSGMTLPLHPLVHIVARTLATDFERSAMAQGIVHWIPGFEDPELHLKVPPAWPHIEAAWEASAADPLVALRLAALLKHRGHRADLNRAREPDRGAEQRGGGGGVQRARLHPDGSRHAQVPRGRGADAAARADDRRVASRARRADGGGAAFEPGDGAEEPGRARALRGGRDSAAARARHRRAGARRGRAAGRGAAVEPGDGAAEPGRAGAARGGRGAAPARGEDSAAGARSGLADGGGDAEQLGDGADGSGRARAARGGRDAAPARA